MLVQWLIPDFEFHLEENIGGVHLLCEHKLPYELQWVESVIKNFSEPVLHTYLVIVWVQQIEQEIDLWGCKTNLVLDHGHVEVYSSESLLSKSIDRSYEALEGPLRCVLLLEHPFPYFLNYYCFDLERAPGGHADLKAIFELLVRHRVLIWRSAYRFEGLTHFLLLHGALRVLPD